MPAFNYTELDKLILGAIGVGRVQFHALLANAAIREQCRALAHAGAVRDPCDDWRILDRRLQSLRKNGRIQFDRKAGWSAL